MQKRQVSEVSILCRYFSFLKTGFVKGCLHSCLAFAAWITFAGLAPAPAGPLDLVVEGKVEDAVLSDGLPNETGQWRTKVQQVFNSKTQRIERRVYEYFDPAPSRHLDVIWYPRDESADRPGRISGVGRMVWRRHDSSAWDPAGIVRAFTGEMRNGRYNGTGELVADDGLTYEGQWQDGRANGIGHLKLPSGGEYLGSFRDGNANGRGREFDVTGEVFEGTFRAGLRQGAGKTKLPSGFTYESSWINGVERPRSQRIRLAQTGNPNGLGAGASKGQRHPASAGRHKLYVATAIPTYDRSRASGALHAARCSREILRTCLPDRRNALEWSGSYLAADKSPIFPPPSVACQLAHSPAVNFSRLPRKGLARE